MTRTNRDARVSMLQQIEKRARDRGLTSSQWLREALLVDEFWQAGRDGKIPPGTTFETWKLSRKHKVPL